MRPQASPTDLWLTRGFVRRVAGLDRTRLRDLYPSEAWSLYRVLPRCRTVVDLGCGSGAMSQVVRAISPKTRYLGVDLNPVLIRRAAARYGNAQTRFIQGDLWEFLKGAEASADGIMAWAVLYACAEFERLISRMIARAKRFVLFDMRVANISETVADIGMAHTVYDGTKGPYVIASFRALLDELRRHGRGLQRAEIAGYDYPVGPAVWMSGRLPQPSVISVVLEKGRPAGRAGRGGPEWFVKVPPGLLRDQG